MTVGDRIRERLEALEMSGAELARRVGVKQPTISALISGKTRSSSYLHVIARELKTTPEYLTGESDEADDFDPQSKPRRGKVPKLVNDDIVEIAEIDLRYGLGGTYLDQPVEEQRRAFSRSWIRLFTNAKPEDLFWSKGQGNSMAPTIEDGEVVLIDRGQMSPEMSDLIWVFAYGDVGMIKRLRPKPDGSVKILSDNQNVPPETAVDGEIHIIGRVVAVLKTV
ncbi:XRE family transcriptional regulator [Altericroceibacterium endophyticum]|uniref:Helix-turn-helix domain-containing protein n=1 Tax=Altericroceibacterium endophyticum TaxID=1808508 RepID=A0A6I4T476_9SPHN|nr:S24 family peptidase [Altericroceibacterium endophyticum]MXO64873.1 helix-turn-helix domain-containing protein [Altericroceibacterium endophyticum]